MLFGWGQILPGTSVPGDFLSSVAPWSAVVAGPPANPLFGDPVLSIYPYRKFVNDELQRGGFPLWNPYIFAGQPVTADPDMALFYPGTLALGWLSAGTAFDVHILVHMFVSALGMYALVRVWGGGQFAAVMAGAAFCGSSAMTVWRLYGNLMSVAAWLPWLVVCFEMSLRRRSAAWIGAGGVVLGLIFTANFLQWALYDVLLLGSYATWLTVFSGPGGRLRPLLHAAAIVALGIGVGAVQLWPLQELVSLSERAEPLGRKVLSRGTLLPIELLTLLAPNFLGSSVVSGTYWGPKNYAEATAYFGFYPLVLALAAPLWRSERTVWFLSIFLLLTASWALDSPTLGLLTWLPGFNVFMHQRMIYLVCFCGAVLFALALDSLFRPGRAWALEIAAVL
ncbi:MAG: hypothetical protein ACREQ9_01930, partial [Candidatus Binatia bacterium]